MADLSGQTLGKYQILDRLGRGGMADVYKGYQPGLDRYVAVKVMHPHLAEDTSFITRFRREAKGVAELRHPNIVQVFDFDVQGDVYYMVMEYIEGGETLKQRLQSLADQNQRLPIERTLDIMIKLADALAYAHGQGMIHRDLKPANVLIPDFDRPVLSDFGIARLLNETGLTASGAMIGTPAYMSPEQGRGEHGDARSDIYSLGIVFYEMLTGRPPYDADTPYAIILMHINEPLTPPHTIIGPMPEAIERIVLKCLAKEPADRFASMADLREALRSAQSAIGLQKAAGTIEAPAPTIIPPKPQPAAPSSQVNRIKPAWLIGGAALLVVGIIVALMLISRGGVSQTAAEPTAQPTQTTGAPVAQSGAPTAPAVQPIVPTNTPQPEVATATLPTSLPTSTPAAADDPLGQGYQQLTAGDVDTAYSTFSQVLTKEPDNALAHVGRAIAALYRSSDLDQAAADIEAAAPTLQNDPILHFARGLQYKRSDKQHDPKAAESELTQAIDQCGNNQPLCLAAYNERAQLRSWDLGNQDGALDDVKHVLTLVIDPTAKGDAYALRANIEYEQQGNLPPALDDLQRAYQANPWSGYLERAARYAVRAKEYSQAIDIYNQLLKDQNGDPRLLAGRAYVEWQAGDAALARQSVDRALQLDARLLEAHYLKGLLLLDAQQPQAALAELQPISVETDQNALDQMSQPFLNLDFQHEIHYDLARAAEAGGDHAAALKHLDQFLQINNSWAPAYVLQAEILKEKGDLAGARASYLKALDIVGSDADLQASIEKALTDLTK